jgi:tRNA(fMet)-specific endonuclease VapC
VDGYLLDTQTLCYWFDRHDPRFSKVNAAVNRLPSDAPLYVSAVTLGEICYGHAANPSGAGVKRSEFELFIHTKLPQPLEISHHTSEPYGKVRGLLVDRFPPSGGWTKKRRAEQMTDPVTGRELGIDENDLWIVAQAIERGLVLATADRMVRIRDAVAALYPLFTIENWTL